MELDTLSSNCHLIRKDQKMTKLTEKKKEHLRKIGACFRCRQPGHRYHNCPLNQHRSVNSIATNTESQSLALQMSGKDSRQE